MKLNIPNELGKSTDKSISGENFYIGNGAMIFENRFIALDAIATSSIVMAGEMSYGKLWYWLVGGILAFIIGCTMRNVIPVLVGLGIAIWAGVGIYSIWQKNSVKTYIMEIKLSSGDMFSYVHKDLDYIRQIMDVLIACKNDKKTEVFQAMYNVGRVEVVQDNSVGKIGSFQVGGSMGDFNNAQNASNSVSDSNIGMHLQDKEIEWEELLNFLAERGKELTLTPDEREKYNQLVESVKEKNASKFKKARQVIGETLFKTILSEGVSNVMKQKIIPIVNAVMKLK